MQVEVKSKHNTEEVKREINKKSKRNRAQDISIFRGPEENEEI